MSGSESEDSEDAKAIQYKARLAFFGDIIGELELSLREDKSSGVSSEPQLTFPCKDKLLPSTPTILDPCDSSETSTAGGNCSVVAFSNCTWVNG